MLAGPGHSRVTVASPACYARGMHPLSLVFHLACTSRSTQESKGGNLDTSSPWESGAGETGEGSGETGTESSAPEETAPEPLVTEESVDDFAWTEGVCQIAMDCDDAIVDSPKTTCDLRVEDALGLVAWEGPAGVELRGRSSMSFPKNQFGVELQDADGEAREANLLGMGAESDWVLNGAWVDRALFRNKMTYDLFEEAGGDAEYGAESRFCELTLNGETWGVYVLTERVKRDASRIDLSASGETDGSSFVLKLDESGGFATNMLGYGTWTAIYPRQEDATIEALDGIRSTLLSWTGAAWSADPGDDKTGIFAYVDMDSAIDFVLMEEFAKNNDGYFLSVHLWKDEGGLIHFVPWDIDLGYGQPSYNDNENPETWIAYRPDLVAAFADDPDFHDAMAARWEELRAGPMDRDALQARIDDYEATLSEAAARNFERWPIEDVDFYGYLYAVESWEEEVQNVRDWVDARLAWMDENVAEW